jgi:hypothetical protein
LEQGEAGAAADVAAQAYPHAVRAGAGQVEEPGAQEEVGGGAEAHGCAGGRHARTVGVVQPDAVGKDAARAELAVALIDVQVAAGLWVEFGHPGHFGLVLGDVGLQMQVRPGVKQLAGQAHLLPRGGGGEARGDGVAQAIAAVPFLDQGPGVGHAALGRIAQKMRAVAVHQALAGDEAHPAALGGAENGVDRSRMHGGENQGRGGAVGQQLVEEELGHLGCMGRIGEGRFRREGVALQPVEELGAVAADDVGLGVVDVGVDEAGHQVAPAVVGAGGAGGELGEQLGGGADFGHVTVLHDQQAVGKVLQGAGVRGRVGQAVQHMAAEGQQVRSGGHRARRADMGVGAASAAAGRRRVRTWAATAAAITAGSLPGIPGRPMGQVRRATAAGLHPRSSSCRVKRARLAREPMRPQ